MASEKSASLLKRIFGEHIKKHSGKLFIAAFCMVIAAAATAANAWILQPVLDEIFLKPTSSFLSSGTLIINLDCSILTT